MKKKSINMKIVCTADLQSQQMQVSPYSFPKGDILLVAGDLTIWGKVQELEAVNTWLKPIPCKYKIIVAGNHDRELVGNKELAKKIFTNAIYLEDELLNIEGLKIYGSPVNEMNDLLWHRNFADNQKEQCENIPKGLDILITHGPPFGILDKLSYSHESVGSKFILNAVQEKKPKYHVFGHIHESYGVREVDKTTFINAALCDPWNNVLTKTGNLLHPPIMFEL